MQTQHTTERYPKLIRASVHGKIALDNDNNNKIPIKCTVEHFRRVLRPIVVCECGAICRELCVDRGIVSATAHCVKCTMSFHVSHTCAPTAYSGTGCRMLETIVEMKLDELLKTLNIGWYYGRRIRHSLVCMLTLERARYHKNIEGQRQAAAPHCIQIQSNPNLEWIFNARLICISRTNPIPSGEVIPKNRHKIEIGKSFDEFSGGW